jgi:hypothetical protein
MKVYSYLWTDMSSSPPGNWTDAADWVGGLSSDPPGPPRAADNAFDYAGLIEVNSDVAVNSLTLELMYYGNQQVEEGSLEIIDGGALHITTTFSMSTGNTLSVQSSSTGADSTLKAGSLIMTALPDQAGGGPFYIDTANGVGGSVVDVTGALQLLSGNTYIDTVSGEGGSRVTAGGVLTLGSAGESASLIIGPSDGSLSADTTVTVGGLSVYDHDAVDTGGIFLNGGSSATATLDVTGGKAGFGKAGIVDQAIGLSGDALLEFASGKITEIASNASLSISGAHAFLADASNPSANSALNGSLTIEANDAGFGGANGSLSLSDGVSLRLDALINYGGLYIDYNPNGLNAVGSKVVVTGAMTNAGAIYIGGSLYSAATTTVRLGSIANFSGAALGDLYVAGGGFYNGDTIVDIGSAAGFGASRAVEGRVDVSGNAQVVFASGEITTIAANAALSLNGSEAVVADAAHPKTDSALTGLSSVAGSLTLENGDLATTGALDDTGTITLYGYGSGMQQLSIGGALTNAGNVDVGMDVTGASPSALIAKSLENSGTINLFGAGVLSSLTIDGASDNGGTVNLTGDARFSLAGALTGAGTVNLSDGAVLQLGRTASGGTIALGTGGGEIITGAKVIGDKISGFAGDDSIDFASVRYAKGDGAKLAGAFVDIDNAAGKIVASFRVMGDYESTNFAVGEDTTHRLLITYADNTPAIHF